MNTNMFFYQCEQNEEKCINIYVHKEMLPAPIIFTTYCLIPPMPSYKD